MRQTTSFKTKKNQKRLNKHRKLAQYVCVSFIFFFSNLSVCFSLPLSHLFLLLLLIFFLLFWTMQTIGYTKDMIKESPSHTHAHTHTKSDNANQFNKQRVKNNAHAETTNILNATHTHTIFELWNEMESCVCVLAQLTNHTSRSPARSSNC